MQAAPRLAAPALVATAIALSTTPASALTWSYCDFTITAGLQLNNDAKQQGNVLELTPASDHKRGSAFTTTQIPFGASTSFHTYFRFRAGPDAMGADGLAFVLQSGGANAIGSDGKGLGYGGIGQSFAVELDTYDNGSADPNSNHVAILFDGNTDNHIAVASPSFPLVGATDRYAWIDYDGPTKKLDVYVDVQPTRPPSPLLTATVDLDAHLGGNVHTILEWQMSTDGYPCCGPSPGGACGAALPACAAATSLCVECNEDTDCGAGKPRCDKGFSVCVACLESADCAGGTPACVAQACVPCASDIDCTGSAGGPTCAPTGACVACVTDAGCAAPTPKCDATTYQCVGCVSNADCGGATPACEPATHACVGCIDDSVCDGSEPVCDVHAKECVAGCHVVSGKDTCGPGTMCDAQDGSIGACQSVGTSSSGMASGSSGMAGGAGGGAGGHGGAGGSAFAPISDDGDRILPLGAGCWCSAGAGGEGANGIAATALFAAALGARRKRRTTRRS